MVRWFDVLNARLGGIGEEKGFFLIMRNETVPIDHILGYGCTFSFV